MTQFELVQKIYSENKLEIDKHIEHSKFPITFAVLTNFSLKMKDLLNGLEALEEAQTFYSSRGLTRILYEHFLVAYYIYTKCRIDKTDDSAADYLKIYPFFELMKQTNYNSRLDKSYDSQKTPLQNFLIKFPEFNQEVSEDDIQEINIKSNKFDIRKILKYMQEELDESDFYKPINFLIHDVCKRYNKTSSFVHGGRMAELETYENTPPIDKPAILKENVEFGKTFLTQTITFILLLLVAEDIKFYPIIKPIHDFITPA